jgi:hypothetical protein
MTRTLKTFLLWLLIAAMPFQAFATNVLRACSSGHQGMNMVLLAPIADGASGEWFDASVGQQPGEEEECIEAASSADQSHQSSDPLKVGSCSACAACCVGAFALPPMLTFKPSSNNAEVHQVFGATLAVGFIPDSLERPPRHFSA